MRWVSNWGVKGDNKYKERMSGVSDGLINIDIQKLEEVPPLAC